MSDQTPKPQTPKLLKFSEIKFSNPADQKSLEAAKVYLKLLENENSELSVYVSTGILIAVMALASNHGGSYLDLMEQMAEHLRTCPGDEDGTTSIVILARSKTAGTPPVKEEEEEYFFQFPEELDIEGKRGH